MPREKLLRKTPRKIGDILVQNGWVQPDDLERALQIQRQSSIDRVGQILKNLGVVDEEKIARALATQYELDFIDLVHLPSDWQIDRERYSFKCKHLKVLPMLDPEDTLWLLLSDVTEDEKLEIGIEDPGLKIQFGVVSSGVQNQVLDENPTEEEVDVLTSTPPLEVDGIPDRHIRRIVEAMGLLQARSPEEIQAKARLRIERGPAFRIDIAEIVSTDPGLTLPEGYVHATKETTGRVLEMRCMVPESFGPDLERDLEWPVPWPPPDLVEEMHPLLENSCLVPAHLRRHPESLRWMGHDHPTREALNRLTIESMGVSLGKGWVDTVPEFWSAVKARFRCLEARKVARLSWEVWKCAQERTLEITPGQILAMCSLLLGEAPDTLVERLTIERVQAPAFFVEVRRENDSEPLFTVRVHSPS